MDTKDSRLQQLNYREKFGELMRNGFTLDEAVENLYINYSSYAQVDMIYKMKKAIAYVFRCSMGDVKLIGSSHTGFSICDHQIVDREHPKDFDFAIVNSGVYTTYFEKMYDSCRKDEASAYYIKNAIQGKIHPLYIEQSIRKSISIPLAKLQSQLGVQEHISVCFYISEQALIQGLVEYFRGINMGIMRELHSTSQKVRPVLVSPISELIDYGTKKI